jgi:hypothetical protein
MKRQLIALAAILALPLSSLAVDGSAAKRGGRVDVFAPSYDFGLALGQGKIEGATGILVFGHNHDLDKTTAEDLWGYGGTHVPPTTATTIYCSSTSTSANQDMLIYGLNELGVDASSVATLNGTTPVAVSGLWYRVHTIENNNGVDVTGAIYVYTTSTVTGGVPQTASAVQGMIENTGLIIENVSIAAIRTVPADKIGYLSTWKASAAIGDNATMRFQYRTPGGVFKTLDTMNLYQSASQPWAPFAVAVPPLTDLRIRLTTTNNDADVEGAFLLYLIDY